MAVTSCLTSEKKGKEERTHSICRDGLRRARGLSGARWLLCYDLNPMLSDFAPILVFLAVCVAFGAGVQALAAWLGPRRPSAAKDLPYECGIVPVESARRRFSVSFYVTAMLFIIFDVESIFLLPWATIVRQLKIFGVVEMGIFIGALLIGLVYVWAKGALRWD